MVCAYDTLLLSEVRGPTLSVVDDTSSSSDDDENAGLKPRRTRYSLDKAFS